MARTLTQEHKEARDVERRRALDAELERIKQDQLARTNNQTGVQP